MQGLTMVSYAFAELLDNALDEVRSGAYVNVDMLQNRKDGRKMVVIEGNGGGMNPEMMRHCMSLGYSAKSKLANTIGQCNDSPSCKIYNNDGNGFKTSTMRLGADVIVFSRCGGKHCDGFTQTIGLLSYTFLKSTGKEDIVGPMLHYERSDWRKNVETLVQWSPFSTEEDLLSQDIQHRGVNRDQKSIYMAANNPNCRHLLTHKHSLRSYVSILYLRLPPYFRIILRGKDVEHHDIVNDMMQTERKLYWPREAARGLCNCSNVYAAVTTGFVKDAKNHVDVQDFNVYHKNRLVKSFWRVWNAAENGGHGIIGVLEANFVEPAHDKQGHLIVIKSDPKSR
ncbi:unnamed protein product [Thlaspi arvense]|uniref:Morc S5 domain-containing protein n=1 Tax=Thlaspi arvense TaxID=13288 RepID=A0AAU9R7H8_THLAR|nr:unnamed protein product [Thlaspi arvense]